MKNRDVIVVHSSKEVEKIKKSCKLAKETLDFISEFVQVGVTTLFLNDKIEEFIIKNGSIPAPLNYHGYPKATCISLNEVICHGIPNETILKEGDILNIDVTTILDGYHGDTSRMFYVGEISSEAKDLLDITKKCLEIGIAQVKPNNRFSEIAKEITSFAESNGYSVVSSFVGHGIGKHFHMPPHVYHYYDKEVVDTRKMLPGYIFTIEPMICQGKPEAIIDEDKWTARTIDGKLSAQYEHQVLVTMNGVEILTE